jgi:uncharacterized protein (TIGR02646 family)
MRETARVQGAPVPHVEADKRYAAARRASWFQTIVSELRRMSGPGERCMWCSGSEAAQVEHLRPRRTFPEHSFNWNNLLWSCGVCNGHKGAQFPGPEAGGPLLDPITEDVWKHLFIDEFGNLTPRWRADSNDQDLRAVKTISVLALDRDALQLSRQHRLRDLQNKVTDTLALVAAGKLSVQDVRTRIGEWRGQSFQPDVADYFLRGPGRREDPFRRLFAVVE